MRTNGVILAGLLAFWPGTPPPEIGAGTAAALLVAARRDARAMAPAVAADDMAYIANQEAEAGLTSEQDLVEAFDAARRLPAAEGGRKAALEAGGVESVLEAGNMPIAERMAAEADAGRVEILDRLIPSEVAAGRETVAWREWDRRGTEGFPYLAAEALAGVARTGEVEEALWAGGAAAIGRSGDVADADIATEFLELAAKAVPDQKGQISAAALRLARGLPGIEGAPGYAVAALRGRLRTVVAECDAGMLGNFDAIRQAPDLQLRPEVSPATPSQPGPRAKAGGAADARVRSFPELAEAALTEGGGPGFWQEQSERRAMKMLTRAVAAGYPLAVARLAVGAFELNRLADARAALRLALDEAERRANAVARGERIATSSSPVLGVFGIAGEIDFSLASRRALALRAGPMRPLVLAHVARMAGSSARWKPGKPVTVLH